MRRAMDLFPWGVVLRDEVCRDQETGEARHVRLTVDATKEYGIFLRPACVNFDWAPDPKASAHVAPVPPSHLGVWRCSRQTHPKGAYAIGDDGRGYHRSRSPLHDRSRLPRRDRSRSISPSRAIEATESIRASSCAAVSLFG